MNNEPKCVDVKFSDTEISPFSFDVKSNTIYENNLPISNIDAYRKLSDLWFNRKS